MKVEAKFFQIGKRYTVMMKNGKSYEGKIIQNENGHLVIDDKKMGKIHFDIEDVSSGAVN